MDWCTRMGRMRAVNLQVTLPLPAFGSSSWHVCPESAQHKSSSPGTGKVSKGATSICSPPAIPWPMDLPTSPRSSATNRAKQEKPMEAAAGSDRCRKGEPSSRDVCWGKGYHGSDSVSFSHQQKSSGFTGCAGDGNRLRNKQGSLCYYVLQDSEY